MTDNTQNGSPRALGTSALHTSATRSTVTPSEEQRTARPSTKNSNALASVLRKTEEPARAQFTPSTYPGVTNLGIASQKVGYNSVAARNPDIKPALQNNLQVQNRSVSDMQYRRFAQYLEEQSGIVLGDNKHYLVNSRLSSLLLRFKVATIDELINRAMQPTVYKEISSAIIDAMTTNETLWFRDTYPYLALRNMILPELARSGKTPIRIWSSACSSGQEPYSIAMVVQEQVSTMVHIDPAQCQIVGTDISPEMLEQCRFAHYDNHALARGLSAERKARFFKPTTDPNVMRVDDKIKQMVNFKQMNLLGSYSLLGRFDIIFCRNVLIYFSNEVKRQILNKFALSLNPGGYLILGSSESIQGLSDKYDMVRCNPGLAYRLKSNSTLTPLNAPPSTPRGQLSTTTPRSSFSARSTTTATTGTATRPAATSAFRSSLQTSTTTAATRQPLTSRTTVSSRVGSTAPITSRSTSASASLSSVSSTRPSLTTTRPTSTVARPLSTSSSLTSRPMTSTIPRATMTSTVTRPTMSSLSTRTTTSTVAPARRPLSTTTSTLQSTRTSTLTTSRPSSGS